MPNDTTFPARSEGNRRRPPDAFRALAPSSLSRRAATPRMPPPFAVARFVMYACALAPARAGRRNSNFPMLTGPFCFGVVIGYVTYRTLRRKASSGLSDIATVIGAIGGAAVLRLFPAGSTFFDQYAVGLAAGFFGYLVLSIAITAFFTKSDGSAKKGAQAANEFLGE